MRIGATREEWKKLYQLAIKCRDMQKQLIQILTEMSLFSVRFSEKEIIYFNILGNSYICEGLSMYQGRKGLNDFMGLIFAEQMNVDFYDMVMAQNCISMHFVDRQDVPQEQYQVISDLNLRFRGNGNWIYFETFETGFYPSICDKKEVLSATRYLEKFIEGVQCYKNGRYKINSKKTDSNETEIFEYYCKDGVWNGRIQNFLMQPYQYPIVNIADDFTKAKLRKAGKVKTGASMEVKTFYYAEGVCDENYDRIIIPKIAAIADHYGNMLLDYQMILPEENTDNRLALILSEWIREYGCPREIIVSDAITKALIEDVCRICKINLTEGSTYFIDEFQKNIEDDINETSEISKGEEPAYDRELLERLGFDMEEIKRKSQELPKDEMMKYITEQINNVLEGIYEEELYDDFDIPFFQAELKNRKEKIQAVQDFFGEGKIEKEVIEQAYREIWIDYSITSWMDMLRESRKGELTALADRVGIQENKSMAKEQLIREIQGTVDAEPKLLADSMDEKEKRLLKYLWKKARKNSSEVEFDEFPSDMKTVLKLLAIGAVDIGLEYDEYESDLLLEPVKEIEKLLKKWI